MTEQKIVIVQDTDGRQSFHNLLCEVADAVAQGKAVSICSRGYDYEPVHIPGSKLYMTHDDQSPQFVKIDRLGKKQGNIFSRTAPTAELSVTPGSIDKMFDINDCFIGQNTDADFEQSKAKEIYGSSKDSELQPEYDKPFQWRTDLENFRLAIDRMHRNNPIIQERLPYKERIFEELKNPIPGHIDILGNKIFPTTVVSLGSHIGLCFKSDDQTLINVVHTGFVPVPVNIPSEYDSWHITYEGPMDNQNRFELL